jgi:anti-anti-sigma factor
MKIFDLNTDEQGDTVTVSLQGELDLASTRPLEEELERVEHSRPRVIVLDLRSLTFLDSTGLRVITSADGRAREQGRRLVIVKGPAPVHRVFEITKLDEHLELVEDAPAA